MRMTNEIKFFKGFFLNENQEFLLKKFSKNLYFTIIMKKRKQLNWLNFTKKIKIIKIYYINVTKIITNLIRNSQLMTNLKRFWKIFTEMKLIKSLYYLFQIKELE